MRSPAGTDPSAPQATNHLMEKGRGTIHPNGAAPPSDPAGFADAAVEAMATNLDMGIRRRVGFARSGSAGGVEVVGYDGSVTTFPNSQRPWVGLLDPAARRRLAESLATTDEAAPREPGPARPGATGAHPKGDE